MGIDVHFASSFNYFIKKFVPASITTTNGLADGGYYEQIEVLVKFTIGPIHDFFATRKFADFPSFVVVVAANPAIYLRNL